MVDTNIRSELASLTKTEVLDFGVCLTKDNVAAPAAGQRVLQAVETESQIDSSDEMNVRSCLDAVLAGRSEKLESAKKQTAMAAEDNTKSDEASVDLYLKAGLPTDIEQDIRSLGKSDQPSIKSHLTPHREASLKQRYGEGSAAFLFASTFYDRYYERVGVQRQLSNLEAPGHLSLETLDLTFTVRNGEVLKAQVSDRYHYRMPEGGYQLQQMMETFLFPKEVTGTFRICYSIKDLAGTVVSN